MRSRYVSALASGRLWQLILVGLLFVSLLTTFYSIHAMREFRKDLPPLWLTPDIRFGDNGTNVKLDNVYESYLWNFAGAIFQGVNTWANDGQKDYPANIYRYQAMLTPAYRQYLTADMHARDSERELEGRHRFVFPIPGLKFEADMVKQVQEGVWTVQVDTIVREWNSGTPVKDRYVRFFLTVVRWQLEKDYNPYALALDIPSAQSIELDQADLKLDEPQEQE